MNKMVSRWGEAEATKDRFIQQKTSSLGFIYFFHRKCDRVDDDHFFETPTSAGRMVLP